ncbi:ATP-binding protein [Carboxylicivirga sp. M1479]|uniref:sensor histidine kinase n=1 Tax=Carboxylicivirga sp. M1479 TaxID=2594476 RepID=UPI001177A6EE|nr:ATP-binding protein [Carboxylicivirga sp. M1479]TRX66375.1 HAMP domain-containing protein [Carboxylicivirga sp. M1479]
MSPQLTKFYASIIIAITLFAIGKFIETNFDHAYTHDADTYAIQNTIKDQQNTLISKTNSNKHLISLNESLLWASMDSLSGDDIYYYLYKDSLLHAWSSHIVPLDSIKENTQSLIHLSNGWYLKHLIQEKEYTLVGISRIKDEYAYQNKFLKNKFSGDFTITHQPTIVIDSTASEHHIYDIHDQYLLSLKYENHDIVPLIAILAFSLYLVSFIILTLLAIKVLTLLKNRSWSNYLLIGVVIYYSILCLLFENYAIPNDFSIYPVFSPITFAVSEWLSSLGSLIILSFFFLAFAYGFYRYFKTPTVFSTNGNKVHQYLLYFSLVFFVLSLFYSSNILIELIVTNSSQASIFFNIEDLNITAFIKVLVICNNFIAIIFIYERLVVNIKDHISVLQLFIISSIAFVCLYGVSYFINQSTSEIYFPLFLIIGAILYKAHRNSANGITYSSFIWVIFISSIYAVTVLYWHNTEKEESNRLLLIDNLSYQLTRESDPVAEMYLSDIEDKLAKDKTLIEMLLQDEDNNDAVRSYLEKTYFYGYWKRYDIEVVICWKEAPLYIEDKDITTNCYQFFDSLLSNQGRLVDACENFYFLNNNNGQISYFGRIPFMADNPNLETTLYCEINSTPSFSGLGYPELLQNNQEQMNNAIYKEYSFGKYINNKLVKKFGNHQYPISFSLPETALQQKTNIEQEDMLHLVYPIDENTKLVLSRPRIKIIYLLKSFSTFALFFFIITALIFLISRHHQSTRSAFSIQEKIQIAFVSLMIFILLVMGVSSVFYSIHQFREKNNQMLSQRIRSVLQEMEQKIINEPELDESMHDYLQYLMQKFSNVFYSDINLYNTNGQLLATSRPELYQQGLSGEMMNTQAYYQLKHKKKIEYIHQERIGELHFTSAYVPIYNYEHETLAYLNLPYFIGNNELKTEISSLIVAVINAYLLFVLFAIGVAVLISRRITRPLYLIQDRLAQIRIGKYNQKIGYKGNDEIGNLVKEYNRMVDEISESAEKLAKSEREMAWREMAKQIAHEIKNPLTPMKLNVQYLTKAWESQREDFDNFLNRVCKTLIEQIDQLHIIANEFSNFAKMPQAQRGKVNLIDKVNNTVALFEKSSPKIHFNTIINSSHELIFADPDQMISVLNNVIKNAVQSIPNERDGTINITVKTVNKNITVSISDNGRGMNEDVKNKIFMPNFTTRSSGMGLGLAIVKNIVKNSGGQISFETKEHVGTTFFISFPIYEGD